MPARPEEPGVGLLDVVALADPPVHARQRKLAGAAFMKRMVRELESGVRERARELLAPLRRASGADFMASVAGPLPTLVLMDLLGFPEEDHACVKTWVDRTVALLSGVNTPLQLAGHLQHGLAFYRYIEAQFEIAEPGPDEDLMGH